MTAMLEAKPAKVGTVLARGGDPIRFLAIVHDVNQDPTWKEQWIEKALENLFCASEQRQVSALRLPLLGALHGKLHPNRFAVLLSRVLHRTVREHLKRLWLVTPVGTNRKLIEDLHVQLLKHTA